jgi:hypothetical protein
LSSRPSISPLYAAQAFTAFTSEKCGANLMIRDQLLSGLSKDTGNSEAIDAISVYAHSIGRICSLPLRRCGRVHFAKRGNKSLKKVSGL